MNESYASVFPRDLPERKNHLGARVTNESSSLRAGPALDTVFSLVVQKIPNLLSPTFPQLKGVLFRFVSCRPGPVGILSTLFKCCLLVFSLPSVGCVL